jgi:hypothetical protein
MTYKINQVLHCYPAGYKERVTWDNICQKSQSKFQAILSKKYSHRKMVSIVSILLCRHFLTDILLGDKKWKCHENIGRVELRSNFFCNCFFLQLFFFCHSDVDRTSNLIGPEKICQGWELQNLFKFPPGKILKFSNLPRNKLNKH